MRMRIAWFLAAAGSGVASISIGGNALAQGQLDVNPPLPNVLLMVDNSGSMERMIDGTLPEDTAENACDISNCIVTGGSPPTTTCTVATRTMPLTANPPANRWNNVLQALTGSPTNGFHCISMPRNGGTTFASEYQINSTPPYDTDYYLNYHRAVAIDPAGNKPCVFAPGSLPGEATGGVGTGPYHSVGNANAFPAGAIINRPYGQLTVTGSSCAFAQNPDGLLGNYQDLIRFGLMTFDQDTSAGTGVTTGANPQVLPGSAAFTGMWSYFPGWDGTGATVAATGNPTACTGAAQTFEVGARNPDAPPWEGRMIYFPSDETSGTRDIQNSQMQNVLNATRPYGGTPLAGMFADAQYYFLNDPNGPSASPGDPLVKGGCRKQFIVLLTDGAPNEDMRPEYLGNGVYSGGCGTQDNPSAPCPYNHPEVTAAQLANPTGSVNPVYTYVIGFALSSANNDQGAPVNCEQIDVTTQCVNLAANSPLTACCELQKIAVAGAPPPSPGLPTPHAYFASTPGDLQAALGAIFAQIATTTTTRSVPSYSSVTNVTASAGTPNQETFYGFFDPTPALPPPSGMVATIGSPWSGDVTRSRFLCGGMTPGVQTKSNVLGDDFGINLNTSNPARYFIAVQAGTAGTPGDSSATLRPSYCCATGGDGLGNTTVTQFPGNATAVIGNITPAALGLPAGPHSCQYTSDQGNGPQWLTDAQCSNMLMDFTFGQSFSGPTDFAFISRVGNAFGGVYHATPTVVGPPSAAIHDDAYNAFSTMTNVVPCTASGAATGASCRQNLLYTATTDGLLHAFWTDIASENNNEMWAMVPPAVLPNLLSSYPASDKFLLDGTPVIKDVVFDRAQGSALAVTTSSNPWHTMLVAAYGPAQLGYYAVDITTPSVPVVASTTPGPKFEWQLTKVPATNQPLFGHHGATPAITTVFIGNPAHEVGVAILPGGWDTAPTAPHLAGGCARATAAGGDVSQVGAYAYRAKVQCWGATGVAADPVVGRSVTVVRLDTGEVIATFMRKVDAPLTDTLRLAGRIVDTPFDSPMTGTPIVFPADVGAIASKVFVSDQDGTIWKLDLTNNDPTKWTGKLFFDLYNQTVEPTSSTTAWSDGQPIAVPMQLALDPAGHVVLAAASGPQDQFTQSGLYFVYSLSETPQTDNSGHTALRSLVNWYLSSSTNPLLTAKPGVMGSGERVSGPMVIFDGTLYFATYAAPSTATLSCTAGKGYLWGRDFVKPSVATDLSQGGVIVLSDASKPSKDALTNGAVIPGVSIQATTACVTLGSTGLDQYVPGASHTSVSSFTAGSFSLVGQMGGNGSTGASTISVALPNPRTPTLINSWASVVE